MTFLKDDSALLTIDPAAEKTIPTGRRTIDPAAGAASVFNRLGGLMTRLCKEHDLEIASVIAVWVAQSGGRPFVPRRAQLYFEVRRFFDAWGSYHRHEFDAHLRFGGHNMQDGLFWENQEYREDTSGFFRSVHHNQNSEYAALTMARTLAGDSIALRAASLGGCLLSVSHFAWMGFENPSAMFEAFQESERAHLLGFFDYCVAKPAPKGGDLMRYLKARDWTLFANHFADDDQTPISVERLRSSYASAKLVTRQIS